jgi:hypothetical protein
MVIAAIGDGCQRQLAAPPARGSHYLHLQDKEKTVNDIFVSLHVQHADITTLKNHAQCGTTIVEMV